MSDNVINIMHKVFFFFCVPSYCVSYHLTYTLYQLGMA